MNNADEIVERLRATTQEMASHCSVPMELWDRHSRAALDAAALIEQQRDETARLREALNHIARDDHATPDVIGWNDTDSLKVVRKFARRALEGTTPAGLDRQGPRNDAG